LVVSIIKAKLTVGLVDKTDITWEIVAPTVWWYVKMVTASVSKFILGIFTDTWLVGQLRYTSPLFVHASRLESLSCGNTCPS
jgi:hypothetical protein